MKKVKLKTKPTTTPNGFCLPDSAVEERIIGKRGKTHGDKTVTKPAKKAKAISKNIN